MLTCLGPSSIFYQDKLCSTVCEAKKPYLEKIVEQTNQLP